MLTIGDTNLRPSSTRLSLSSGLFKWKEGMRERENEEEGEKARGRREREREVDVREGKEGEGGR